MSDEDNVTQADRVFAEVRDKLRAEGADFQESAVGWSVPADAFPAAPATLVTGTPDSTVWWTCPEGDTFELRVPKGWRLSVSEIVCPHGAYIRIPKRG